jgi:hypothetical protein
MTDALDNSVPVRREGKDASAKRRRWATPKVIVSTMIRQDTASTIKGFVSGEHHDTSSTILS